MSMLEPNNNTILWNQIVTIPRHVTIASGNLQRGSINGFLMNANARENRRNLRG